MRNKFVEDIINSLPKERVEKAKLRLYKATKSTNREDLARYLMGTTLCGTCKYYTWQPSLLCGVNPVLAQTPVVVECDDFSAKAIDGRS